MVARNLRSLHRLFIPSPCQFRKLYVHAFFQKVIIIFLVSFFLWKQSLILHYLNYTKSNARILHILLISIRWEKGLQSPWKGFKIQTIKLPIVHQNLSHYRFLHGQILACLIYTFMQLLKQSGSKFHRAWPRRNL